MAVVGLDAGVVVGVHLQLGGPGATDFSHENPPSNMRKVTQFRVTQCSTAAARCAKAYSQWLLTACCLESVSVNGGQLSIETTRRN